MIKRNKAQNVIEYAVVIAVVAAALVAMRVYFVRSVQDKYRQSGDVFGDGEQFSPGRTQSTALDGADFHVDVTAEPIDICPTVLAQLATYNQQLAQFGGLISSVADSNTDITGLHNNASMQGLTVRNVTANGTSTTEPASNTRGSYANGTSDGSSTMTNGTGIMTSRRNSILRKISDLRTLNPECF